VGGTGGGGGWRDVGDDGPIMESIRRGWVMNQGGLHTPPPPKYRGLGKGKLAWVAAGGK
jgi:hypothetical protein